MKKTPKSVCQDSSMRPIRHSQRTGKNPVSQTYRYCQGRVLDVKQLIIIMSLLILTAVAAYFITAKGSSSNETTAHTDEHAAHASHADDSHDGHSHQEQSPEAKSHQENSHEAKSHKEEEHEAHGSDDANHQDDEHNEAQSGDVQPQTQIDNHKDENSISLTSAQISQTGITLAVVKPMKIATLVQYAGVIKQNTDQQAHISTPLSGQVLSSSVRVGQSVRKGQVLATLFVPEVVSAQQRIKLTEAQLKLSKAAYIREKQLWQQGIAAKQAYLQAEFDWTQANINHQTAQQALSAYGNQVGSNGRFYLRAPINGTITQKDLSMGETVLAGVKLATLSRLDKLWVDFPVPLAELARVASGDTVWIHTPSGRLRAKVLHITPQADSATKQLMVRAQIATSKHADTQLRPDMAVSVSYPTKLSNVSTLSDSGDVSTLPVAVDSRAIQWVDGKQVVFIRETDTSVKDNWTFKPIAVMSAQAEFDGFTQIKSGLTKGMNYVVTGSFALKSELEKSEATHAH